MSALLWLLGTFGVTGIILLVLAFMIPSVGLVLESIIRFISTPFGQIVLAIALITIAYFVGDLHGRAIEKEACAAAQAQAELEAHQRDAAAQQAAQQDADQRIKDLQDQAKKAQEDLDAYANSLPKNPNCILTDTDRQRL